MSDNTRGIYEKFNVRRLNDPTGKHSDCRYFVIDLIHDAFAAPALQAYARACEAEYPALASDLRAMFPPALASEEGAGRGERFRLEGKGLIDTEGGLDRCTGCGQLPPHEGCKAICAACAPPTGACSCVGCSIHAQGSRAGAEAAAKDCEREAEACIDVAQALDLDEEDGDQVFAQNILLDQAGRIRLLSPPAPSTDQAPDGEDPNGDECTRAFDRGVRWTIGLVRDLDLPNGDEIERALGYKAGLSPPWPPSPSTPADDKETP